MYSRVEAHGAMLYEKINNSKRSDRKVFFVHGGVDAEQRELISEITEQEKNAIIVASLWNISVLALILKTSIMLSLPHRQNHELEISKVNWTHS